MMRYVGTYKGQRLKHEDDCFTPIRIQKQLIDEQIQHAEFERQAIRSLKKDKSLWKKSLKYLVSTSNPLVREWRKVIKNMSPDEFLQKYEAGILSVEIEVDFSQFLEIIPFDMTKQRLEEGIMFS